MINRLFKTFLFLAFIMPAGVNGQQRAESQEALMLHSSTFDENVSD
jgi:hypothetical protein